MNHDLFAPPADPEHTDTSWTQREVRFYSRREEIWNELVKTGAIETDTAGHGPGRE